MLNKITVSENHNDGIDDKMIRCQYEFKLGIDLEKNDIIGEDLREEFFDAILDNFKLELMSKIYK